MSRIITCTSCAYRNKEEVANLDVIKCNGCGEPIIVAVAVSLAVVKKSGFKNVNDLKKNREIYIEYDMTNEILNISNELVEINPFDYYSLYLQAYAENKMGNSKLMKDFFTTPIVATTYELKQVVNHIIKFSDVALNKEVLKYLKKLPLDEIEALKEEYNLVFNQRVNFNDLKMANRDVYISFDEADNDKVIELIKLIKDTGLSFITSTTPAADRSKLINKCLVFVAVSSQASQQSTVVMDELSIAMNSNMQRVEAKFDKTERTVLFNHAFENKTSVDLKVLNDKTFNVLSAKVFELLKDSQNKVINLREAIQNTFTKEVEEIELTQDVTKEEKIVLSEIKEITL